ncbi:MAG: hypothetical protein Q9225_001021 [Loekoesia sp. 1 TL-2023]
MLFSLLLAALACRCTLAASTDVACNIVYGQPLPTECILLLSRLHNPVSRFMGVPSVGIKPAGVTDPAWGLRITLPWVRDQGGCNIALLSIMEPNNAFTWAVDSFLDIAASELGRRRGLTEDGIIENCLTRRGIGGFRKLRKSVLLNGEEKLMHTDDIAAVAKNPSGSRDVVMVLFQKGSAYEQILLSGLGARHYDAARELPDGTIVSYWFGDPIDRYSSSTSHGPSLSGANFTESDE